MSGNRRLMFFRRQLLVAALTAAWMVPAVAQQSPYPYGSGTAAGTPSTSLERLDRNGDGFVSREEIRADKSLESRFTALDKDGDGRLSRSELMGAGSAAGPGAPGGTAGAAASSEEIGPTAPGANPATDPTEGGSSGGGSQ